MYTNFDIIQMT